MTRVFTFSKPMHWPTAMSSRRPRILLTPSSPGWAFSGTGNSSSSTPVHASILALGERVLGSPRWSLGLIAAGLVGVTYLLAFWGTYGTGLKGSLISFLGPFYYLPALACVTLLAARGFGELWRRDRLMTLLAVGGMVFVSGDLMTQALHVNLRLTADDRRLYTPIAAAKLSDAIVFVPPMWGPYLLHPFAWLQNQAHYNGETVYALDRGEPANLALLAQYRGRTAHRLVVHGQYRSSPPDAALTTSVEPMTITEGDALELDLTFENPTVDPDVRVEVSVDGRTDTFLLDTDSQLTDRYDRALRIQAGRAVELEGPVAGHVSQPAEQDRSIGVSISVGQADGSPAHTLYDQRLAYAAHGSRLKVLRSAVVSVNELAADPVTFPVP